MDIESIQPEKIAETVTPPKKKKKKSVKHYLIELLVKIVLTVAVLWISLSYIVAINVCHCFHCFPSISHEVIGPDAIILVF